MSMSNVTFIGCLANLGIILVSLIVFSVFSMYLWALFIIFKMVLTGWIN